MLAFLFIVGLSALCSVVQSAPTTLSSLDDLPFDEFNRLSAHVLLYHGGSRCDAKLAAANIPLREIFKVDQNLINEYFRNDAKKENTCQLVCMERGQHSDHIYHPLPTQIPYR
jgi:hypothetical protein